MADRLSGSATWRAALDQLPTSADGQTCRLLGVCRQLLAHQEMPASAKAHRAPFAFVGARGAAAFDSRGRKYNGGPALGQLLVEALSAGRRAFGVDAVDQPLTVVLTLARSQSEVHGVHGACSKWQPAGPSSRCTLAGCRGRLPAVSAVARHPAVSPSVISSPTLMLTVDAALS